MISIDECKKHLGGIDITDTEVEELRGILYGFINRVLDKEFDLEFDCIDEKYGK